MPNPYHDETGRFCSKEEMGAAVDRLATAVAVAGDDGKSGFKERYQQTLDAYFELRREYDAINRGVTEMPENWVGSIATSASVQSMPDTAAGIEGFYRAGLSDALRQRDDEHVYKAVDIYTHENTPQWIKDDIHRNASAEIKAAMINHLSYGEKYPEISAPDLLPFTQGDNGHSPKVTRALLASSRMGFDTKYELAKDRGQLGWFISQDSRLENARYERIPDLEADLKKEWRSPLRSADARHDAAMVLARNTRDQMLRESLRESAVGEADTVNQTVVGSLASNPYVQEDEGIELLRHTLANNIGDTHRIYNRLQFTHGDNGNALSPDIRNRYSAIGSDARNYRGVGEAKLTEAAERVAYEEATMVANASKARGAKPGTYEFIKDTLGDDADGYWHNRALVDAEPGNYEELVQQERAADEAHRAAARRNQTGKNDAEAGATMDALIPLASRRRSADSARVHGLLVDQIEAERTQARQAAASA